MVSLGLRRIGGALASFWAGGSGPTRAQIQSALLISGYSGSLAQGTKQEIVLASIIESDDPTAQGIIDELLSLLRESDYDALGIHDEKVDRLNRAVTEAGYQLSEDGFINWEAGLLPTGTNCHRANKPALLATPAPPLPDGASIPADLNVRPQRETSRAYEVASPDLELFVSSLRRLGMGGARPLIQRRRADRPSLRVDDEFDVQDLVEMLARCLYGDVRREEPTPSSAGSSSRMDLHLREGQTAVEVKVTAHGRGENPVKKELLVDINDYRNHPTVRTLIAVIYDLAGTFENPLGFEHDLSHQSENLTVRIVVVPWVGPRARTSSSSLGG